MGGEFDELCGCDNNQYDESSADESEEFESYGEINSKRLQTSDNHTSKLRRLPTRKPDLNNFNRNALMARENRRKKKEYMENLEKQVTAYRSVNKKLKKLLKKQIQIVEELKHEKKYYQSVLANKTQIMSLINAVKKVDIPLSVQNSVMPSTPILDTTNLHEEIFVDRFLSDAVCDKEISTDFTNEFINPDNWDTLFGENDILNFNTPPYDSVYGESEYDSLKSVVDDHNYCNNRGEESNDVGICLHVSEGKVSLRFCPACDKKSAEEN